MKLSEQTVLLSGGAGAIGSHLARALSSGAKQLIVLDKDFSGEGVDEALAGISTVQCDLTDDGQVRNAVDKVLDDHGPISVLINCAGLIYSEPLVNLVNEEPWHDREMWRRTIDVNLNGTFYLSSCLAGRMVQSRTAGCIINFSSISASGNAGQSAYSAAKAAVEALTVTWGQELGMFGIRTAAIAPGFFDTESTHQALSEDKVRQWRKATPLGRLGQLEELTRAIEFIVENDFFTGRVLALDGGLRI